MAITTMERMSKVKTTWAFLLPQVPCPPNEQLVRACSRWEYGLIEYAVIRAKERLEQSTQDADTFWRYTLGVLLHEDKRLSDGALRHLALSRMQYGPPAATMRAVMRQIKQEHKRTQ